VARGKKVCPENVLGGEPVLARRAGFCPADRGISSSWRAARVCRLLRVTEVCPAPPSSQLRPEAGPCRRSASTARRAGVQSHDALFRSAGRVSTSGVSKVGEGPRPAGTRRPPVQDRISPPGRFTRPRANHSQYVEQRVVPHVISLPCRTRASIVTCWRPCALLARSIRARALTPRRPCHPLVRRPAATARGSSGTTRRSTCAPSNTPAVLNATITAAGVAHLRRRRPPPPASLAAGVARRLHQEASA